MKGWPGRAAQTLLLSMVLFQAGTPAAWSDCASDDFDEREARVERKIADGVLAGKLTAREAERFRKQLARIAKRCQKCRTSGGLSYWEVTDLQQQLLELSWKVGRKLKDDKES